MGKLDKVKKMIKSLRFRVVFVIIVAGIVPVTLLSLFIVSRYESTMIENETERLKNASVILKNDILTSGYLVSGKSDAVEARITELTASDNGRIMIINKDFVIVRDTYNIDTGKTCISDVVVSCFEGNNSAVYNKKDNSIEIAVALTGSNDVGGVLLLDFQTENINNIGRENRLIVIVALMILFIIIVAVAVTVGFYMELPFKRMKKHIRELDTGKSGDDDTRLGFTEIDDICKSMDEVILRLRKVDESREEFVSNVSHELKTPITSIKVLADSLIAQEDVPNEMYKEFMQDIASEIDRENSIINDLLALVRMNKDSSALKVSQVNIVEIVEMVIKRVKPIADKRNIEIIFENFKPVTAEVDEVKMTMVITNLIENAVKYNILDGWVKVSLNEDLSYFYLKVSDSGIGIPEESQMQVFERFYRVDKARSRETGGTGLGLAITNTVVNLHKGEIKLYSKEGEGSTFTVRIPLHYVP